MIGAEQSSVRPGGWWALTLLVVIYVQSFVDRTILSSLGEPIRYALRLSDTQLGLLGGFAFALTYSVLGIPAALLSERIPRKALIAIAMLVWSMMTMACGLAGGFLSLLALRAGVGIGEAGFTPPAHALISDFFPPKRRALALALFSASIPVGVLVGAIGGGWLAHRMDWRSAFVVVGLPGLFLAPLLYLTMREPGRGEAESIPASRAQAFATVASGLWAAKPALPLILAGALASIPGYALYSFGVSYFVRVHGLGLVAASTAFGLVVAGGQFVGMIGGGQLTGWLARDRPLALLVVPAATLAIGGVAQIAGWLQPGIIATIPLLAIGTISGSAYLGPSYAALHGLMDPRTRATGMSIVLLIHALVGLGLGPPLIGLVSDHVAGMSFGGDYRQACHAAVPLPQACAVASAAGLKAALMVASAFAFAAAALFLVAARTTTRHDSERTS